MYITKKLIKNLNYRQTVIGDDTEEGVKGEEGRGS